jgi:DNA modification methylase
VKSRGVSKTPSLHDNLIIEGDNLKALKALLPAYHGKVKCIYIDPPYNTGNEGWIYNDRVNSPMIRDWLGKTVDRDDLTRHDKWCCMMLPRLKLLRELLRDDGAIFVSIDDNEVHHLRALMDEVFGEENFVADFIWQKRYSRDNRPGVNTVHDHIVAYARRSPEVFKEHRRKFYPPDENLKIYRNPNTDPHGRWRSVPMTAQGFRKNQMYPIKTPAGAVHKPPAGRCWSMLEPEFEKLRAAGEDLPPGKQGRIWFGNQGKSQPGVIRYLSEVEGFVPWTWLPHEEVGHTDEAKKEIYEILGTETGFDTPKPSRLIRRFLEIYSEGEDIILDSFAGSGTTAQAVLTLNKEDGAHRQFILCQMPFETKEQEEKKENICERITAERVRRVIKGVPNANDEALREGLGGTFSYYRLGRELEKQAILDGKDLPGYEALAGYVFWTATGEEFQPKKMKRKQWFIGESREYAVFLLYDNNLETLKDMALTLDIAKTLPDAGGKRKLVFAPTKYLDDDFLHRLRIEFCQLPFEIYQVAEKK